MRSNYSLPVFTYLLLSFYFLCRVKQETFRTGILSPLAAPDSTLLLPNLYAERMTMGMLLRSKSRMLMKFLKERDDSTLKVTNLFFGDNQ